MSIYNLYDFLTEKIPIFENSQAVLGSEMCREWVLMGIPIPIPTIPGNFGNGNEFLWESPIPKKSHFLKIL